MVNMSILLALNEKKNAENIIIVLPKAEDKSVSSFSLFFPILKIFHSPCQRLKVFQKLSQDAVPSFDRC